MTTVKSVNGPTTSQDVINFNGLTRSKVDPSKAADMIRFGEDEADEDDDEDEDYGGANGYTNNKNANKVNTNLNVLSLYVHSDDDDDIDSLPGDNDATERDEVDEDPGDVVGSLKRPMLLNSFRNNFYRHRIYHPHPFTGSSWTLSERNCSLSSSALNQIMVDRGASSLSSHSDGSSLSPLSRTSSSSSSSPQHNFNNNNHQHHGQSINPQNPSSQRSSPSLSTSEKVILLPRLSIQNDSINRNQIKLNEELCQFLYGSRNQSGLWSTNANLKVSTSPSQSYNNNDKDNNNVLRLHVSGQVKSSKKKDDQIINSNERISIISRESQSSASNKYKRLEGIDQSSSSYSPSNDSSSSKLLPLKSKEIDQRTWRQCKNSTEVILVANSMDYSSSSILNQAKHKSKRKQTLNETGIKLSPEQELARYHRQFTCEAVSLIVLIIAVTFLITTPFILIPMVTLPDINQDLIRVVLWLSLLLSIIFTIIGAFIGNVYWYFDPSTSTFRWRLHCGSGPKHYWGSTLFNFTNAQHHQSTRNNQRESILNPFANKNFSPRHIDTQSEAIVNNV